MQFGPESLLPPVVAIVLAIATRRVVLPLAAGVFMGAFLLASNSMSMSLHEMAPWGVDEQTIESTQFTTSRRHTLLVFLRSLSNSVFDKSHLQALGFSLLLGAMVGILEGAGGMKSLIVKISRRIRSRCGAQTMISTAGLFIFFDDYANTLLLGGTMRSTADRYKISRAKLAYLVDSTAAPVAGLALVSTWAAIEISYMAEGLRGAGIEGNSAAFEMFVRSIPYRFYAWLALVMVFVVSITGRDFGAMRAAESAEFSREIQTQQDDIDDAAESRFLWLAAVVPVMACLIAVAGVIAMTGAKAVEGQEFGSNLRMLGEVLGNGDSYLGLITGGLVGVIVAGVMHFALGACGIVDLGRHALRGAMQMMPVILILWFAWALSEMTQGEMLDTGGYLAGVLSDRLNPVLLPTFVFLLAGAIAFSTGTSWGTMGILTPLSISLALQMDPTGGPGGAITLATSGAVLAGAIFGDHCSPISDTTVLSSRASGCDHVEHVRTQMPYALLVAVVCVVVGTIPAAYGISPWLSLVAGAVCLVFVVRMIGKLPNETPATAE
jgi:Na+/H+ antiporter NhaC